MSSMTARGYAVIFLPHFYFRCSFLKIATLQPKLSLHIYIYVAHKLHNDSNRSNFLSAY